MSSSSLPTAGPPSDEATAEPFQSLQIAAAASTKRKRRPAGTPDPDAEVVRLSARSLLALDRYVCAVCGRRFRREQNLQIHRRAHELPWKLAKQDEAAVRKKAAFVCPEPGCLHNDPSHALNDIIGVKKHFLRKHVGDRRWACGRCSRAYAVHADLKAHLRTCGTRARHNCCRCGRVFSRVVTFVDHQKTCPLAVADAAAVCEAAAAGRSPQQHEPPPALSLPAPNTPSTNPSSDIVVGSGPCPATLAMLSLAAAAFHRSDELPSPPPDDRSYGGHNLNLELQLVQPGMATSRDPAPRSPQPAVADAAMLLQLSIGLCGGEPAALTVRDD